jgi:selenocysteine lyase/cysteine desulfurase
MTREAFGAEFLGAAGYLDTPTYGLPPQFVADALRDCVRWWEQGTLTMSVFDESVHAGRAAYASLVGADEGRVALGTSVSSLIGLVAASIPDGSRVATLRGEFTSATFPFAAQAKRGVTVTELAPGQLESTASDFDVVAVSLVQSADGAVLDTETLRYTAVESGTITVIDATHALGWKQVDLAWADSVIAHGYKWLLAPRGAAWMSLSERMIAMLVPHAANWSATGCDVASSMYGLPIRLADDARRLDSSPVWFSVFGAGLSLPWLASLDRAAVEAHTVGLANQLRTELGLAPAESAIVSIPGAHAAEALQNAGIRASLRAGGARVAFHLYNTVEDLDCVVDALKTAAVVTASSSYRAT